MLRYGALNHNFRHQRRFFFVISCGVVVLVIIRLLSGGPSYNLIDTEDLRNLPQRIPISIVSISTRGYDARNLVRSLREEGEFTGSIVLLWDGCSPLPPSVESVEVSKNLDAISSKQLKTQIYEYLPMDYDNTPIFYMDSDIEVNKPINAFLDEMQRSQQLSRQRSETCNAWFNYERLYHRWRQGHIWQGGMFYLPSQVESQNLLFSWGEEIGQLKDSRFDQSALVSTLEHHPNQFHICELPHEVTLIPSLSSLIFGVHATLFTHWTKSSEVSEGTPIGKEEKMSLRQSLRSISLPKEAAMKHRRVNQDESLC